MWNGALGLLPQAGGVQAEGDGDGGGGKVLEWQAERQGMHFSRGSAGSDASPLGDPCSACAS